MFKPEVSIDKMYVQRNNNVTSIHEDATATLLVLSSQTAFAREGAERVGERAGRVGERAGRVGERAGRVGERAGRVGERAGRVGERAGRVRGREGWVRGRREKLNEPKI